MWPFPKDYLVEDIPLSTRSEVGGARIESLEQVTKSLMDFFFEVTFTHRSISFPFLPLFSFPILTLLVFAAKD